MPKALLMVIAIGKTMMKHFEDFVAELVPHVNQILPWDLVAWFSEQKHSLLLDVREPHEFHKLHIPGSINVPRGVLEPACDHGYEETVPELVEARNTPLVVICRSGNRSILAAHTLQLLGFNKVYSLKTGIRGWNDYEQPLVNGQGNAVDINSAEEYFALRTLPQQARQVA